jgi:hypothetical protein
MMKLKKTPILTNLTSTNSSFLIWREMLSFKNWKFEKLIGFFPARIERKFETQKNGQVLLWINYFSPFCDYGSTLFWQIYKEWIERHYNHVKFQIFPIWKISIWNVSLDWGNYDSSILCEDMKNNFHSYALDCVDCEILIQFFKFNYVHFFQPIFI